MLCLLGISDSCAIPFNFFGGSVLSDRNIYLDSHFTNEGGGMLIA